MPIGSKNVLIDKPIWVQKRGKGMVTNLKFLGQSLIFVIPGVLDPESICLLDPRLAELSGMTMGVELSGMTTPGLTYTKYLFSVSIAASALSKL